MLRLQDTLSKREDRPTNGRDASPERERRNVSDKETQVGQGEELEEQRKAICSAATSGRSVYARFSMVRRCVGHGRALPHETAISTQDGSADLWFRLRPLVALVLLDSFLLRRTCVMDSREQQRTQQQT